MSLIEIFVALSDAKQQLTPDALGEMMKKIVLRKVSTENAQFNNKLEELRFKIDDQVVDILSERMKVARDIGTYKKEKRNTQIILQPSRWDEIIMEKIRATKNKGLSEKFVTELFQSIHNESIMKTK